MEGYRLELRSVSPPETSCDQTKKGNFMCITYMDLVVLLDRAEYHYMHGIRTTNLAF